MNEYNPKPMDTSKIELPQEIYELVERLSEDIHEVWSQQRIKDGWQYGEQRDDIKRLHPCLVPYSELPESEKEYDRNTVIKTLKCIVALGYRISN